MRLESSSTRGILRFADTVSIDWSALPEGVIVLCGAQGSGKTTIAETPFAALFREFPFRSAWDLSTFAQDRDSFIEAVFSVDTKGRYRARVNIDAVRRASEAILEHTADDGTKTLLNDGKVTTFDAAVQRAFPPKEIFLASTISCQDKTVGSLAHAQPKDRKRVIGQMIGLDDMEAKAQTAKQAAALVDAARVRLQARRYALDASILPGEDEAGIDADAARLTTDAEIAEQRRTALARDIADVEAQLGTVQDQVAARAVATQAVRSLESELANLTAERSRVETARVAAGTALLSERRRLEEAYQRTKFDLDVRFQRGAATLRAELDRLDQDLAATFRDIDERIANNRKLLDDATAIRAAVTAIAEIDGHLQTARSDQALWQQKKTELEARFRSTQQALAIARLADNDLKRAETDAQLIDDVPCQASGEYAGCQFLVKAIAAKGQIESLREKAAAKAKLDAEIGAIDDDLRAACDQLSFIAQTITALEGTKKAHQSKAKLAEQVAAAESRIEELVQKRGEAQIAADRARPDIHARSEARERELRADMERAKTDLASGLAAAEARAAEQTRAADGRLTELDAAQPILEIRLTAAREQLANADRANEQAQRWQGQLDGLRREWDQVIAALARVEAGRQELDRRRQTLADKRGQLADVDSRLRALDADLVEWQLLARALGREGLQTLEIDAAGPLVSAYANDLMAACFGPRFSIELVTQAPKADGKGMREVCEITVTDNERGGSPRDLGMLSGGERVMVEECLRNALALYANTRSSMPARSIWRDESDQALDAEHTAAYVPMLRKLREMGGYHQVIVVSHNEAVIEQADAQLRFADGKVEIVLPPYGRTAAA